MHTLKKIVAGTLVLFALIVSVSFMGSGGSLRAALPAGSHLAPKAVLNVSQSFAISGEEIVLDASQSRDARGAKNTLSFRFDYEGNHGWTKWDTKPTAKYTFVDPGYYPTRVQVRDSDGAIDEALAGISVTEHREQKKPYGVFHVTPTVGDTDTVFTFKVNRASGYNTPVDQLDVRFDFDGDGTFETAWSRARTFTYTYPENGSKEPIMEVRDRNGDTSRARGYYVDGKENPTAPDVVIGRIEVGLGTTPLASFRLYRQGGLDDRVVYFDASESRQATAYRWDFEGDGEWDSEWMTNPRVVYTYTKVGRYPALLQVKSATGKLDQTEQTVEVAETPHIRPEADFTITNTTASTDGYLGAVKDVFQFNAGGSRDPAGSSTAKLKVRWDFEGDREWDTTFATEKVATHTYLEPGDYNVKLEVMNEFGLSTTYTRVIHIVANTQPRVYLRATPKIGTRDTEFDFSANLVDDGQSPRGQLSARFDFDGDGVFDTPFATSKQIRHRYEKPGRYTATVEVRDVRGTTAQNRFEVEVVEPNKPVPILSGTPATGTFATTFVFDASATYEPTGIGGPLMFRWKFSSSYGQDDIMFDTGWSTNPVVQHRYDQPGRHIVHLMVKNSINKTTSATTEITIHPDSSYLAFLRQKNLIKTEEPDRLITRGELAELIIRAAGVKVAPSTKRFFADVDPGNPRTPYILAAMQRGFIPERDRERYYPNAPVPRIEAVWAVVKALYPRVAAYDGPSHFYDVPANNKAARFIHVAYEEGIIPRTANQKMYPAQEITQGEIARMIAPMLEKYDTPRFLHTTLINTVNAVKQGVGGLTVPQIVK